MLENIFIISTYFSNSPEEVSVEFLLKIAQKLWVDDDDTHKHVKLSNHKIIQSE